MGTVASGQKSDDHLNKTTQSVEYRFNGCEKKLPRFKHRTNKGMHDTFGEDREAMNILRDRHKITSDFLSKVVRPMLFPMYKIEICST